MDDFRDNTSIFMNEILGLIEQGVALMWEKEYDKACLSFTMALQINKAALLAQVSNRHLHAKESLKEVSSSFLCCQLLTRIIARSLCNVLPRDPNEYSRAVDACCWPTYDRSIYVHSAPLTVTTCNPKADLFPCTPCQDMQTTLSVIIIFNLALAHHLYALDQTRTDCAFSTSRGLLRRALALYRHSKDLLHHLKLESCWYLHLAIVNNEAQILAMTGEHSDAEELLQGILSGLCCLNGHYRDGGDYLLPIAALEGFSHNTSHLILRDPSTAEAA